MTADRRIPGVVNRRGPVGPPLPLVFDSPHSGNTLPQDFQPSAPSSLLRLSEDFQIDQLYAAAPEHGAVLVAAEFPRIYIDPNRNARDIDPALLDGDWPDALAPTGKSRLGVGLIWRLIGPKVPIYSAPLPVVAVQRRLQDYYLPYHAEVQSALDRAHHQFGAAWHINCHSMPSIASPQSADAGRARPDFTISDRDGSTCEIGFLDCVVETLRGLGYDVRVNDPYKGDELIRRHGRPGEARHSLQIEVNRRLYMDEVRIEPNGGFNRLQQDVTRLIAAVAAYVSDRLHL